VNVRTIAKLPLLTELPVEDLNQLLDSAAIELAPKGTVLFEQGGKATKLHLVIKGAVELYARHSEKECGIMLLRRGDVFMPAAALYNEPYLNSARTLSPTQLLLLDIPAVRRLALANPTFGQRISRVLAGHFRMCVRQIVDLKCRPPAERLAAFLLRLVDSTKGVAELPMPKRQLAARLGMAPETLSRALSKIADHGLLVQGHLIVVRDRERIEAFCSEETYYRNNEGALDVHAL
jgi:CRP/FNR family transcriptional activator FtrB